MLVYYALLSKDFTVASVEDKKKISDFYVTSNWRNVTTQMPLADISAKNELLVIRTDNLTIIDFDCDTAFNQALQYNSLLHPNYQCNYIVKSTRKGGHFYFSLNEDIALPINHTKQTVLDILSGEGHNAIAPTMKDKGKTLLIQPNWDKGETLVPYNAAFNTFVSLVVATNLPEITKNIVVRSDEAYSDDALYFIRSYIAGQVSNQEFDAFYNLPSEIPPGASNSTYLRLSTRLGCDETISTDDYLNVMTMYNMRHNRKTAKELASEITSRMVNNKNGLWKYNPDKLKGTYTLTHKRLKTQISVYFDSSTLDYIIYYLDGTARPRIQRIKNKSLYSDMLEKIGNKRASDIRNSTHTIVSVDTIHDYSEPQGFNPRNYTFNTAFMNNRLAAFHGAKPDNYQYPEKMIELCKYMWGDNTEYILGMTKYRYTTFEFSPVVTYLKGTEGSGKNVTINILTAGFSQSPQSLNYQLLKDKHSNWQTEPNAEFSEIGDWKPMERADLLSELKTISGSNGKVTFRDMQKVATTVNTLIKIWITGNEWVRLHTDSNTQRRIHVVYMPKPLTQASGGPYSASDIEYLLSEDSLVNFYYWLGNESDVSITKDQYHSAECQKHTESYKLYKENTESPIDKAASLIFSRRYSEFVEALELFNITLSDIDHKRNRQGNLVVAAQSLKDVFTKYQGSDAIHKVIDRLSMDMEGGKRLKINRNIVEKYITIYEAPEEVVNPLNLEIDE